MAARDSGSGDDSASASGEGPADFDGLGNEPGIATNKPSVNASEARRRRALRIVRIALWALVVATAAVIVRKGPMASSMAGPLPVLGSLPEFELTSQVGEPVGKSALSGGVWIADFIFTSCTQSCPMLTSRMKQVSRNLAEASKGQPSPVKLVSFSVDPINDTPEKLGEYASRFGATPSHWLFLTGATDGVQKVVTEGFKLGVTRIDRNGVVDIVHANKFVLVDKSGQLRGYYDAESVDDMKRIVADAMALAAAP